MFKNISIKTRLTLVIGLLALLLVGLGAYSLHAIGESDAELKSVVNDRLIPAEELGKIGNLMRDNIRLLQLGATHDPRLEESDLYDYPVTRETDAIERNITAIGKLWQSYLRHRASPEEKALATRYAETRGRFVKEGLRKAA
ncbi:MAG TPA: hypothetical protein DEP05_07845, partial [Betaproteobacteria bacterium]|nr:hypothetical protein [Betaproteobacteria bacterium]